MMGFSLHFLFHQGSERESMIFVKEDNSEERK